jgi:hypothetical protein
LLAPDHRIAIFPPLAAENAETQPREETRRSIFPPAVGIFARKTA